MTDGTAFIAAAYILTGLLLGGYALSLVRRLRRAREISASEPEADTDPLRTDG